MEIPIEHAGRAEIDSRKSSHLQHLQPLEWPQVTAGCGHRKIFHIFRARSQAAHWKCSAISGLKRNTDVERKRGDVKLKRPKEAGPELTWNEGGGFRTKGRAENERGSAPTPCNELVWHEERWIWNETKKLKRKGVTWMKRKRPYLN
jgi:hypothetical protein